MKSLWFSENYLKVQKESLQFLNYRDLTIPYDLNGNTCQIGFVGPYSCAFSPDENTDEIDYFNSLYMELIEKVKPFPILIRVPIQRHFPREFKVNIVALDAVGFKPVYIDINSSIQLDSKFRDNYNRNRLRDLRKENFVDFEVFDGDSAVVYNLIALNRNQKNISMSLSYDALKRNLTLFPERFRTKVCIKNGVPAAAAILINVNSEIQYVFMWGHDRLIENSGLALFRLADDILHSALVEGFRIVCLGTSSVFGEIDSGLFQFKNSLGAKIDLRYTLRHDNVS